MAINKKKLFFQLLFCFTFFISLFIPFWDLSAAPNYYYSAINYEKYQKLEELKENELADKIELYLQKKVPGLDANYRDVIDALISEGYHVYLRGGVVRDLLSLSSNEPSDVDLDYTGSVQELIEILKKHHWQYTHFPHRQVVTIGDYAQGAIDAVPVRTDEEPESETSLEFTINNIFYHANTKSFLRNSEIGLMDLSYDRIHIQSNHWKVWLYQSNGHRYYKIFRFWKMVGKGYVYSEQLQRFFYEETLTIKQTDPEGFQIDLNNYLSTHLYSYDDVYHGSIAIMGYDWAQKNINSNKEEITKLHSDVEAEKSRHTYYP